MKKTWIVLKWEFINRVRSKLFILTTFLLPFFMVGMMYIPALLMDLEPETITQVGLVYDNSIDPLVQRLKDQTRINYRLKNGNPQFLFSRLAHEVDALDSVAVKSLDGYLLSSDKRSYQHHSLFRVFDLRHHWIEGLGVQ